MDFLSPEDSFCQTDPFLILPELNLSDYEDEEEDEPENPATTTGDESSDSGPSCRWPEEKFPKVNCPYFKEGYEKRTEKKYMIRLYWTKEGRKHIQLLNDYLALMIQVEETKGSQRAARRRIAGVNWAPGESFERKREGAFTYYRNLATFLKTFLERPIKEVREDMDRYEDIIKEAWANFPKAACRGTVPFDVFINIFERETAQSAVEAALEAGAGAISPVTTEEGSFDFDDIADMDNDFGLSPEQQQPLEEDLGELLREFDAAIEEGPPLQRRRLSDIASYEAIKRCLASKKRAWCARGSVIGLYDDGLGPLKSDVLPLTYKVCSTDPCMVEDPLHGVSKHDQVLLVKLGDCPVKLHDDAEYAKLKNMEQPLHAYVYVHKRTEIRVTTDRKQHSIFGKICSHQEYTTEQAPRSIRHGLAIFDRPSRSAPRVGYPVFQGVEGVRVTIGPEYVTPIKPLSENKKKKKKKKKHNIVQEAYFSFYKAYLKPDKKK